VPKQVDHEERRARIADAVLEVLARGGVEDATVRHVAAAAGVSAGMVQHYFATKDELMRAALERAGAGVQERLGDPGASPRALLRALFEQVLPLDEQRRREGRVFLSVLAYAAVHPAAGGPLRDAAGALRAHLAAGAGDAALPPATAAAGLLALADGLGVQVLTGQLAAAEALTVFDAHLDLILGPT
jgi:AcrR family transcriptional regulator